MSKYIPFTTEQKERAASVDLEEFLRRRGEKLITSGRDKRLASDHSITIRGCEWFDHATEQGGRAISFVKQFYGLSYPDAMSLLLGDDLGGSYPAAKEKEPEPAKPFVLRPQSESMRRVYAYLLQKRCIDREILNRRLRQRKNKQRINQDSLLVTGAVQEGHDLTARAGPVGAEQTAADTAGDAVLLRPFHGFVKAQGLIHNSLRL